MSPLILCQVCGKGTAALYWRRLPPKDPGEKPQRIGCCSTCAERFPPAGPTGQVGIASDGCKGCRSIPFKPSEQPTP